MRFRCATLLCLLLAAAGCGQKGPLFLPGDPSEGRIVLPDELAGQEQGEGVEEPGQEPPDAATPPGEGDPHGQDPQDANPQDENDDQSDEQ
ncbi:MAG TPA: hypothetical protein VF200_02545 [Woeseiaceae bacterium]